MDTVESIFPDSTPNSEQIPLRAQGRLFNYFHDCFILSKNILGIYGFPEGFLANHTLKVPHRHPYYYLPYWIAFAPLWLPYNLLLNIGGNTALHFFIHINNYSHFLFESDQRIKFKLNAIRQSVWGALAYPLLGLAGALITLTAILYHSFQIAAYLITSKGRAIFKKSVSQYESINKKNTEGKKKLLFDRSQPSHLTYLLGGLLGWCMAIPCLGALIGLKILCDNLHYYKLAFKKAWNTIAENPFDIAAYQSLNNAQFLSLPSVISGLAAGFTCAVIATLLIETGRNFLQTIKHILNWNFNLHIPITTRRLLQQRVGCIGSVASFVMATLPFCIAAFLWENARSFKRTFLADWQGILELTSTLSPDTRSLSRQIMSFPGFFLGDLIGLLTTFICAFFKESFRSFLNISALPLFWIFNKPYQVQERSAQKKYFGLVGAIVASIITLPLFCVAALFRSSFLKIAAAGIKKTIVPSSARHSSSDESTLFFNRIPNPPERASNSPL